MDGLNEKKKIIEEKIVELVIDSIDKELLTMEQAKEISSFCLSKMNVVASDVDLSSLLEELAIKWPMFNQLVIINQGEIRQENEKKITDDVISLAKDGRIEEAAALAKAANN